MCAHVHPTTLAEITTVARGVMYSAETRQNSGYWLAMDRNQQLHRPAADSRVAKFGSMQLMNGLKLSALPLDAGSWFTADQLGGLPGFTNRKAATHLAAQLDHTGMILVIPV